MGISQVLNLLATPPQDTVNLFVPHPLLKVKTVCPFSMAKTSSFSVKDRVRRSQ